MSSVVVIDYGMGNLHSIAKALQHATDNVDVRIVSDATAIRNADRVVFPGVGAIRDCMWALNESGLADVIREVVKHKPVLGICLGMQALLSESEENESTSCLDIIPGRVKHFATDAKNKHGARIKIPHMGWNQVEQQFKHPLWQDIPQNSRFYFVHSYFAQPDDVAVVAATSEYSGEFCCAVAKDNVFAVQFHPEKSQMLGLQLLKNFLYWDGAV
jgi:glutamine amidotransferase